MHTEVRRAHRRLVADTLVGALIVVLVAGSTAAVAQQGSPASVWNGMGNLIAAEYARPNYMNSGTWHAAAGGAYHEDADALDLTLGLRAGLADHWRLASVVDVQRRDGEFSTDLVTGALGLQIALSRHYNRTAALSLATGWQDTPDGSGGAMFSTGVPFVGALLEHLSFRGFHDLVRIADEGSNWGAQGRLDVGVVLVSGDMVSGALDGAWVLPRAFSRTPLRDDYLTASLAMWIAFSHWGSAGLNFSLPRLTDLEWPLASVAMQVTP